MQIRIRSRVAQRSMLVVLSAAFLVAAAWIVKSYIAYRYSRTLDLNHLTAASKLDPGDAEYHIQLGRLYQYSVNNAQPEKAIEQFRMAAKLDPYEPQAWLNLAAALEFQGDTAEAEQYLRHASDLAPHLPLYQWTIGNYFLLHGNTGEAFRHLKVVLAGSREYDQTVFNVAWKASGSAGEILQDLIPWDLPAEFSYLNYLIAQQNFADAQSVWARIVSGARKFDPHDAAPYIDALLRAGHPHQAYQVWSDLQGRGIVQAAASASAPNLITDGDFEDSLLQMGFGWRIIPVAGVYAGLDTSTFHSPGHALGLQFSGKQNIDYRQIYQFVKVAPNRVYHLQAYMKVQGITTDSGPCLEVRDAYDPPALDKFSKNLTGTTPGWETVSLDFRTGPKTELIIVALARVPAQKYDTEIAGRVWLDDVSLVPISGPPPSPAKSLMNRRRSDPSASMNLTSAENQPGNCCRR